MEGQSRGPRAKSSAALFRIAKDQNDQSTEVEVGRGGGWRVRGLGVEAREGGGWGGEGRL